MSAYERPVTPAKSRGYRVGGDENILSLGWEMFGELCRALAIKVAASGYRPDLVIGIAKAGVIPGAVVASMLRCDFHAMKISRRLGAERVREKPKILSAAPRQATRQRVLIVDEICTTGETMRMALAAVRNVNPADVRTATSFVRVRGFRPDFYALETDDTIVFPWDRQLLSDEGELLENPQYSKLT
jgi:uncharacterized protein